MNPLHTEKIGRNDNFDFLRFILALLVMFTHAFYTYQGPVNSEPLWRLSAHQLNAGTLAVNFFFVISGYLVLQSWMHSKGIIDFLKKRVLRIYPGFIMVCCACAFVFGPMGNGSWSNPFSDFKAYAGKVNIGYLFYTTACLQEPLLPETLKTLPIPNIANASIWTIWYEFRCYVLLLIIGLAGIFRRKISPLVLFILVFASNICFHRAFRNKTLHVDPKLMSEELLYTLLTFEYFILFFLAGSCFYYYREYIPKSRWLFLLSIVALVISLQWIRVFEMMQVLFGSYILFYIAFSKRIHLYNFARFGDFSYGIYLYSWPVQQLVVLYFGTRLNFGGAFIVSLLIVLPIAFLSWHLIEKQFLKLKTITFNFRIA